MSMSSHAMTSSLNRSSWFIVAVAFLGFCISGYALFTHLEVLLQAARHSHGRLLCDVNTVVSCSVVLSSRFSTLFSIPLGSYGMAYFAFMLVGGILPCLSPTGQWALWRLQGLFAGAGLISVAALVYITYGILHAMCPVCTCVHVLVLAHCVFVVLWFMKLKKRKTPPDALSDQSLTLFLFVGMCLSAPPLIIGLFIPFLVNWLA